MTKPRLLATPVDGYTLPASYAVQRCPSEYLVRQDGGGHGYDGNYAVRRGCGLAFAFKLKSGDPVGSLTCPGCGGDLTTSTRRLRQGFLVLTDADVKAIQDANGYTASRAAILGARRLSARAWSEQRRLAEQAAWAGVKGVPVAVSVLEPATSEPEPEPEPEPVAQAPANPKLASALAALKTFDDKPRCSNCWGYNASHKKSDLCGSCREWGTGRGTADGDRDQYTWARQDLVKRVERYGGTAPASPLGPEVDAHIAERDRRNREARERRIAELRARGVRV